MATNNFMDDKSIGLEDKKNGEAVPFSGDSLLVFLNDRYTKSEESRRQDEQRWLKAYRNYRGIYGPEVKFTETEKSRVFIKVTKTKVLAAYGQITDVLFANNKFPLSVDPTVLPDGVVDTVHFDAKAPEGAEPEMISPFGYKGDGKDLAPGATLSSLMEKLGPLKAQLKDQEGLKEGPGVTPSSLTFHPAMVAAKKMEKKIHDQLG